MTGLFVLPATPRSQTDPAKSPIKPGPALTLVSYEQRVQRRARLRRGQADQRSQTPSAGGYLGAGIAGAASQPSGSRRRTATLGRTFWPAHPAARQTPLGRWGRRGNAGDVGADDVALHRGDRQTHGGAHVQSAAAAQAPQCCRICARKSFQCWRNNSSSAASLPAWAWRTKSASVGFSWWKVTVWVTDQVKHKHWPALPTLPPNVRGAEDAPGGFIPEIQPQFCNPSKAPHSCVPFLQGWGEFGLFWNLQGKSFVKQKSALKWQTTLRPRSAKWGTR